MAEKWEILSISVFLFTTPPQAKIFIFEFVSVDCNGAPDASVIALPGLELVQEADCHSGSCANNELRAADLGELLCPCWVVLSSPFP